MWWTIDCSRICHMSSIVHIQMPLPKYSSPAEKKTNGLTTCMVIPFGQPYKYWLFNGRPWVRIPESWGFFSLNLKFGNGSKVLLEIRPFGNAVWFNYIWLRHLVLPFGNIIWSDYLARTFNSSYGWPSDQAICFFLSWIPFQAKPIQWMRGRPCTLELHTHIATTISKTLLRTCISFTYITSSIASIVNRLLEILIVRVQSARGFSRMIVHNYRDLRRDEGRFCETFSIARQK